MKETDTLKPIRIIFYVLSTILLLASIAVIVALMAMQDETFIESVTTAYPLILMSVVFLLVANIKMFCSEDKEKHK